MVSADLILELFLFLRGLDFLFQASPPNENFLTAPPLLLFPDSSFASADKSESLLSLSADFSEVTLGFGSLVAVGRGVSDRGVSVGLGGLDVGFAAPSIFLAYHPHKSHYPQQGDCNLSLQEIL